ncbi:MAG: hypothetical protein JKY26_03185 [Pseudomonas sp.]|nr:hypothetical protein [Pseudomonas sp.]
MPEQALQVSGDEWHGLPARSPVVYPALFDSRSDLAGAERVPQRLSRLPVARCLIIR